MVSVEHTSDWKLLARISRSLSRKSKSLQELKLEGICVPMLSGDANTVIQLSVWPPKPPWAQCLRGGAPHSVPQCGSPSAALCSVLRENMSWAIYEVQSTPEVYVLFPLCHFPPSGHNVSSRMLSHYRDCADVPRNVMCCLPWVHWGTTAPTS